MYIDLETYIRLRSYDSISPLQQDGYLGFSIIEKDGLFGFIDSYAYVIVEPKYNKVLPFSEGVAAVCCIDTYGTEWWGYIDTTGFERIPLIYDSVEPFNRGSAKVTKDGISYKINK